MRSAGPATSQRTSTGPPSGDASMALSSRLPIACRILCLSTTTSRSSPGTTSSPTPPPAARGRRGPAAGVPPAGPIGCLGVAGEQMREYADGAVLACDLMEHGGRGPSDHRQALTAGARGLHGAHLGGGGGG